MTGAKKLIVNDFKTIFEKHTTNYQDKKETYRCDFSNMTLSGDKCVKSIKCVTFEDDVLFESTNIEFSIKFINCDFKKRVSFKDANIAGSLEFENCIFDNNSTENNSEITHHHHLDLRGLKLRSSLVLRGSKCKRTLSLTGAHIEGSIKAGPQKRKLSKDKHKYEIVIFKDIDDNSKSEFESIRMADCKVKGYIDFGGTTITKSIIACGTHCHGDFILTWRNRYLEQVKIITEDEIHERQKHLVTLIKDDLNLDNMRIDGDFDCRGSVIKGRVLLSRININGFVTFRPWHMLEERETGRLYQSSDEMRKKLEKVQAIQTCIGQLYAQHAIVRGGFILTGINIEGKAEEPAIQMTSAEAGSLSLSNYKELETIGDQHLCIQTKVKGNIILDYSTINGRLSCNGACISGNLSLDRITVRGDINLSRWINEQDKSFCNTIISGDIVIKGATIAGSVFISGLGAKKGIDLFATQIGGSLNGFKSPYLNDYLNKTKPNEDQEKGSENKDQNKESKIGISTDPYGREFSIRGTSSTVKGNIHLTDFQVDSSILFDSNATIQGNFRLNNCTVSSNRSGKLNFENSIVTGDIEVSDVKIVETKVVKTSGEDSKTSTENKIAVSDTISPQNSGKNHQEEQEERDYFLNLKLAKIDGDITLSNCNVFNGINCTNAIIRGYLTIKEFKVYNRPEPKGIKDNIVCDIRAHHANFSTVQISGFDGRGISFDHSTIQQNMLFEEKNKVALGHRRNREGYHLSLLNTKILGNLKIEKFIG